MFRKIVITAGNGFLGKSLTKFFSPIAEKIVVVSRKPVPTSKNIEWQQWDGRNLGTWTGSLEGADAVINLAGKNVNCRYTEKNKREILDSRMYSTQVVGEAIQRCVHPPRIWLNASSATIYVDSREKLMTESSGDIGDDFSMTVCKLWEKAFDACKTPATRKIALRTSIVLGLEGGALPALINLAKFGLGGHQGDGKQICSWIHVNDFCRAIEWLVRNESAGGVYNITAPVPLPNSALMKLVREKFGLPIGLPAPAWLLEIGAILIRTETELVLKSRKVYPKRLLDEGFVFRFDTLETALHAIDANGSDSRAAYEEHRL